MFGSSIILQKDMANYIINDASHNNCPQIGSKLGSKPRNNVGQSVNQPWIISPEGVGV